MPAYQDFTVHDFLQDAGFRSWVLQEKPAEGLFWDDFLERYPQQRQNVRQARALLLALREEVEEDLPSEGRLEILFDRIEQNTGERSVLSRFRWLNTRAAAAVLLIAGLAAWWLLRQPRTAATQPQNLAAQLAPGQLETVDNRTGSVLPVVLPDGSRVTLGPQSRLFYQKAFADSVREIYLSGEAFFEVQKNPGRPFLVKTDAVTTRVLGTSFRVRAYDHDRQVNVIVKTGRVSVFPSQSAGNPNPETEGLVLTPNQQVEFTRADAHFSRSLVENPLPLTPVTKPGHFLFRNAPVVEILELLKQTYGVDILYDKPLLNNCRLTTALGKETLFEKLDIICEGIGAGYKVVDAQIILASKGCE